KNSSATSGTMNWRNCANSTNSHDSGCRRRSAPGSGVVVIVVDLASEDVAQVLRVACIQATHADRTVARARGMDHQGGQAEAPLQRPALQVQVLDPRLRDPG